MPKIKAKAKTHKKTARPRLHKVPPKPKTHKAPVSAGAVAVAADALRKLRGFARLAVLDPTRLKTISAQAGRRAQKLYGHKVRWSKKKARELAPLGGKAAQAKYKKDGHPWGAGSPLRPKRGKAKPKPRRKAVLLGTHLPPPPPPPVPVPDAPGVSLAPSDAQPTPEAETTPEVPVGVTE